MKGKILIADDEPRIRKIMTLLLSQEGYEVKSVENGKEAVAEATLFNPDVILLDQQMPIMNGTEALDKIRLMRPNQVMMLVTAFGTISLAVDAVKKGSYDFIEKFFNSLCRYPVMFSIDHIGYGHHTDTGFVGDIF